LVYEHLILVVDVDEMLIRGWDGKDSSRVTISLHLTTILFFGLDLLCTVLDASCKVKIMCDDAVLPAAPRIPYRRNQYKDG
jgi:hypothetical protein